MKEKEPIANSSRADYAAIPEQGITGRGEIYQLIDMRLRLASIIRGISPKPTAIQTDPEDFDRMIKELDSKGSGPEEFEELEEVIIVAGDPRKKQFIASNFHPDNGQDVGPENIMYKIGIGDEALVLGPDTAIIEDTSSGERKKREATLADLSRYEEKLTQFVNSKLAVTTSRILKRGVSPAIKNKATS